MSTRLDQDFRSFVTYYGGLHRRQAARFAWAADYCKELPPVKTLLPIRDAEVENSFQIARDMSELSELVALSHFSRDREKSVIDTSWSETWLPERSDTDNSISTDSEFVRMAYSRNSRMADPFLASSSSSSRNSPSRHCVKLKDNNSSDLLTDNNISSDSDFVEIAYKRNNTQASTFTVSSISSTYDTDKKAITKERAKKNGIATETLEEFTDFVDRVFHKDKIKLGNNDGLENSIQNTADMVSEFNSVESLQCDNISSPEPVSKAPEKNSLMLNINSISGDTEKISCDIANTHVTNSPEDAKDTAKVSQEDCSDQDQDSVSHIESIEKSRELSNNEFIDMINKKYNLSSGDDSRSEEEREPISDDSDRLPQEPISDDSDHLPRQTRELTWSKWKLALLDDENEVELKPRIRTALEQQINERISSASKLNIDSNDNVPNFSKTTSLPNISLTDKIISSDENAEYSESKWNAITDELTKIKSSLSASLANGFTSLLSLGDDSEPEIQAPTTTRKRFDSAQETGRRLGRTSGGQPRSSSCGPRTHHYSRPWANLFGEKV